MSKKRTREYQLRTWMSRVVVAGICFLANASFALQEPEGVIKGKDFFNPYNLDVVCDKLKQFQQNLSP